MSIIVRQERFAYNTKVHAMFEIKLKEINVLRDEIVLRPDNVEVIKKCEKFIADYNDGFREVENTSAAKVALWKLIEDMPRVKGRTAAARRLQQKNPELYDMFGDMQRRSALVTEFVDLHCNTAKVVVELYARRLINGFKSVKEYKIKDSDRTCVFTHKETDTFWIKEFDNKGNLIANTICRPRNMRCIIVDSKINEKNNNVR